MKSNLPEGAGFKKGQSGNPLGNALDRHSTKTFAAKLNDMIDREIDYKSLEGKKARMKLDEGVLTALFAKALFKQDVQAAKVLIEMRDGKPAQANTLVVISEIEESKLTDDEAFKLYKDILKQNE